MKIFSVSSKFMDSSFCGISVPCGGVCMFLIDSALPAHEKEYFSLLEFEKLIEGKVKEITGE